MSARLIWCVLATLAQAGGSNPAIRGFRTGAGHVVSIIVAVLVAGVLVALIRAGRSRK